MILFVTIYLENSKTKDFEKKWAVIHPDVSRNLSRKCKKLYRRLISHTFNGKLHKMNFKIYRCS